MKPLAPIVVLALAIISMSAESAQSDATDRTHVVHVKTSLNHLTVIELGEPVLEVAAGNPSFKIEWRENKVFIQPTDTESSTNLFIWTASRRLNYELEPPGAAASMDFAIDQPASRSEPVNSGFAPSPAPSITDVLLRTTPVRLPAPKGRAHPVEVWISDLYEKDGRVQVRYTVFNHGVWAYSMNSPYVYQLSDVHSPVSLYGLVDSQLGDAEAARLKVKEEIPVRIVDTQLESEQVLPGEQATGVVVLELSPSNRPLVLHFQFASALPSPGLPRGRSLRVAAFLVK